MLRWYLWLLGGGLFLEGAALLALPLGSLAGDPRHNLVHVAWGVLIMLLLLVRRDGTWDAAIALIFGAFYIGLAIGGVLLDRPFGLLLGPGENAFHFVVGPLALILGVVAYRADAPSSSSASSAATVASAAPGSISSAGDSAAPR
jgi:hypothetical protein